MTVDLLAKGCLSVLLVCAAAFDVLKLRIPNRLTLLMVAVFVPFAALEGVSAEMLVQHVAAGCLLFCVALALALLGQLGGGDVKLMGAIGLWLGFGPVLLTFLSSAAALSLVLVATVVGLRLLRLRLPLFVLSIDWIDEAVRGRGAMRKLQAPYGVPLALAALTAIWSV